MESVFENYDLQIIHITFTTKDLEDISKNTEASSLVNSLLALLIFKINLVVFAFNPLECPYQTRLRKKERAEEEECSEKTEIDKRKCL